MGGLNGVGLMYLAEIKNNRPDPNLTEKLEIG
jgi:hypothetical protein